MGTIWEEAYTHKENFWTLLHVLQMPLLLQAQNPLFIQNMGAVNYTKLLFLEKMGQVPVPRRGLYVACPR